MKRPQFLSSWPVEWKLCFEYDLQEVFSPDPRSGYSRAYLNRRQHTLDLIQKAVSPPARVLDVAAAQGNFSIGLAELGYEVTWNDLRVTLEEYVRMKDDTGRLHYGRN